MGLLFAAVGTIGHLAGALVVGAVATAFALVAALLTRPWAAASAARCTASSTH